MSQIINATKEYSKLFEYKKGKNALLIVDVENEYLVDEFLSNAIVKDKDLLYVKESLNTKFKGLANIVEEFHDKIDCFTTCCEDDLYDGINKSKLVKRYPQWNMPYRDLPIDMIRDLQGYETVYVCGLWKERCVCNVTKRLNKYNINGVVVDHPYMSFSVAEHLGTCDVMPTVTYI